MQNLPLFSYLASNCILGYECFLWLWHIAENFWGLVYKIISSYLVVVRSNFSNVLMIGVAEGKEYVCQIRIYWRNHNQHWLLGLFQKHPYSILGPRSIKSKWKWKLWGKSIHILMLYIYEHRKRWRVSRLVKWCCGLHCIFPAMCCLDFNNQKKTEEGYDKKYRAIRNGNMLLISLFLCLIFFSFFQVFEICSS